MDRVLRPNSSSSSSSNGGGSKNTPDVVRSALDKRDSKINSTTIDSLFGAPRKIDIPERYVPEADVDHVTPEERQVRLKKADSIRKMLADSGAGPLAGE